MIILSPNPNFNLIERPPFVVVIFHIWPDGFDHVTLSAGASLPALDLRQRDL